MSTHNLTPEFLAAAAAAGVIVPAATRRAALVHLVDAFDSLVITSIEAEEHLGAHSLANECAVAAIEAMLASAAAFLRVDASEFAGLVHAAVFGADVPEGDSRVDDIVNLIEAGLDELDEVAA